jgi:hypothetical protein
MASQIEFVIPKGYKLSDKSTDDKLVFEINSNLRKDAREFLLRIFKNLEVRVSEKSSNCVFLDFEGYKAFFFDLKNRELLVSDNLIWNFMSQCFSMDYGEVKSFIGDMMKEVFGLDVKPKHWMD